jgi:hypothetical protein
MACMGAADPNMTLGCHHSSTSHQLQVPAPPLPARSCGCNVASNMRPRQMGDSCSCCCRATNSCANTCTVLPARSCGCNAASAASKMRPRQVDDRCGCCCCCWCATYSCANTCAVIPARSCWCSVASNMRPRQVHERCGCCCCCCPAAGVLLAAAISCLSNPSGAVNASQMGHS